MNYKWQFLAVALILWYIGICMAYWMVMQVTHSK